MSSSISPDETDLVIPNLIQHDLKVLFVGINPGLRSAAVKHHFASRSNRFWKLLWESGLTPVKLSGELDQQMLDYGYGITNMVSRSTATAAEITKREFEEGSRRLRLFLHKYHPRIVAFLGKDIYRYFSNNKKCNWGVQPVATIEGIIDFLVPNPSGLNRMPIPEQLEQYKELKRVIASL